MLAVSPPFIAVFMFGVFVLACGWGPVSTTAST
jgi:hypothetical protein